jgi:hypothetical protein
MGFHDHRGHVPDIKYFCLGYGYGTKCDSCQRYSDWLKLNELPNEERLVKQCNMVRIEEDLCILNDRKYFNLMKEKK